MMLLGYVSDENYFAIADALIEVERGGEWLGIARSSPSGAIYADVAPGEYRVTVAKSGFGPKRVDVSFEEGKPYHFRLLSDCLLGYAWPKWVKSGEKSEFRLHAAEACRLSLWRYGKEKEFVRMLGWYDEHAPRSMAQVIPDGDFTQTGIKWNWAGYPKHMAGPQTEAPERSGLYYFHAETESGGFFSFPWVVAPATPQSQIAVLASTNTWNAYNNFGGRSNYINATGLPARPTVNPRQDNARFTEGASSVWQYTNDKYLPLSFDRPEPFNSIAKKTQLTDPIRGRQACHLAETEWRLLGWLEREGFSYDFYSDYQLHAGELDLDAYRTLILSTHPEYWSKEAYNRVKKWVFERGGKLVYLGGNGIDAEVEFLSSSLVRHSNWMPEDGSAEKRDDRFHASVGESPAALLGVVYSKAGIGTSAPYRVVDASNWVFADTGLKDGELFGSDSLHERCPGGASGHETDKRAESSPAGTQIVARGLNPDCGGAEMAVHETSSGGAVYSAGSITWTASILVDPAIAQITRNVLRRFGVTRE